MQDALAALNAEVDRLNRGTRRRYPALNRRRESLQRGSQALAARAGLWKEGQIVSPENARYTPAELFGIMQNSPMSSARMLQLADQNPALQGELQRRLTQRMIGEPSPGPRPFDATRAAAARERVLARGNRAKAPTPFQQALRAMTSAQRRARKAYRQDAVHQKAMARSGIMPITPDMDLYAQMAMQTPNPALAANLMRTSQQAQAAKMFGDLERGRTASRYDLGMAGIDADMLRAAGQQRLLGRQIGNDLTLGQGRNQLLGQGNLLQAMAGRQAHELGMAGLAETTAAREAAMSPLGIGLSLAGEGVSPEVIPQTVEMLQGLGGQGRGGQVPVSSHGMLSSLTPAQRPIAQQYLANNDLPGLVTFMKTSTNMPVAEQNALIRAVTGNSWASTDYPQGVVGMALKQGLSSAFIPPYGLYRAYNINRGRKR
jgi:hypothetical protein